MPFTIVAVTRPEYEAWLAANKGSAASGAVASGELASPEPSLPASPGASVGPAPSPGASQ
jgi:hypothetical protein